MQFLYASGDSLALGPPTFNVISNGWVIVLEKDHKVRTLAGYKFDLNKNGLFLCC